MSKNQNSGLGGDGNFYNYDPLKQEFPGFGNPGRPEDRHAGLVENMFNANTKK